MRDVPCMIWFIPGKPVPYNHGLLSMNCGLLQSVLADDFGLLGFPALARASNLRPACQQPGS